MYTGTVYFTKDIERDNWEKGCYGGVRLVYDDKFTVDFEDTEDLLEKLAQFTVKHFDVKKESFLEYVENECENNRFDYAQPEDDEGKYKHITKEDPEGWYAMYFYTIEVFKKVEYKF